MSARPTHTTLRLTSRGRSPSVERALTDFGAEESFERAAKRFEEHYGWGIGRTTVLRVVEQRAHEAERYVAERLQEAAGAYKTPLAQRPGVDEILVELDGCEIRTGTLVPAVTGEKSDVVTNQLFAAAVDRGLSERTQVVGVADGGNGLREALDEKFAGMRFILDRPHFKGHLYETADAMGLDGTAREEWVKAAVTECEAGKAIDVVNGLRDFEGNGDERAHCLAGYLERFKDAVDYEKARASGYPTGSGEVESAHRYIPQKRMKIPGACRSPTTINPMLALRVMRENNWWDDYWATA